MRIIHTRHEAAAVHMADAWGRLGEEPGVALVTAGPGHLNALSALYGALMAESPLVLLSGHAPAAQAGRGALQEIDPAGGGAPGAQTPWGAQGPPPPPGGIGPPPPPPPRPPPPPPPPPL